MYRKPLHGFLIRLKNALSWSEQKIGKLAEKVAVQEQKVAVQEVKRLQEVKAPAVQEVKAQAVQEVKRLQEVKAPAVPLNGTATEVKRPKSKRPSWKVYNLRITTTEPKKRVRKTWYVVDALNLLYRFYFARTQTATKDERVVVPILNMFLWRMMRLIEDHAGTENPLVVVFDGRHEAPKQGFRMKTLASYKQNRPEMPEQLKEIIPHLKDLCRAMGANVSQVKGIEADDVIGTIASNVTERGENMMIISNDKDFFQLLQDERVFMLKPIFNQKQNRWQIITAQDFRDKHCGLEPDRLPDLLALTGDAADNIPGVKGIGSQMAPFLLSRTPDGSLETLLENLDQVEHKYRKELEPRAADLPTVRRVATINKRIPMHLGLWIGLRHRPKLKLGNVEKVIGKLGGDTEHIRRRLTNMGYRDN